MGKRFAAVATAAAIGVGGLTVAAVNPLSTAGAGTVATPQGDTGSAAGQHGQHGRGHGKGGPHGEGALTQALDKLVADGTLTREQADKVLAAVKAEAKSAQEEHKGDRKERRQELLGVVAKAIGSTPEDVAARLQDGTSIAEQAKAEGVDRQVVADALTKAFTARLDAAVADGRLSAEQATKAKDRLAKVVDRALDGKGRPGGDVPGNPQGRSRDHGRGHGRGHSPEHRRGN